jgi:hypothetical protein
VRVLAVVVGGHQIAHGGRCGTATTSFLSSYSYVLEVSGTFGRTGATFNRQQDRGSEHTHPKEEADIAILHNPLPF